MDKFRFILLIFILSAGHMIGSGCTADFQAPSPFSNLLPAQIDGYVTKDVFSAKGTDYCISVDTGRYERVLSTNNSKKGEHVSATICNSSHPEKTWKDEIEDLYETSSTINDVSLAHGITGKSYSPYGKHTFILWRDGSYISYVVSISDSGDAYNMAVEVANALIENLSLKQS
jgi:hypothetical protein